MVYTHIHIYIYIHVPICIKWPPCRARGTRVGGSQFLQRSEVPGARRHVAIQRSVVVQTAARTRPSQGPSGRARAARHAAAWTHSLVIHGAHRTSPSAAGMVPRRPAAESTIKQPLIVGDGHCSEQLHVRVPSAHMLPVPSHSNVTLSGAAAPPQRNSRRCVHIVAALRVHRDAHIGVEGFSTVCASHVIVAHRITL